MNKSVNTGSIARKLTRAATRRRSLSAHQLDVFIRQQQRKQANNERVRARSHQSLFACVRCHRLTQSARYTTNSHSSDRQSRAVNANRESRITNRNSAHQVPTYSTSHSTPPVPSFIFIFPTLTLEKQRAVAKHRSEFDIWNKRWTFFTKQNGENKSDFASRIPWTKIKPLAVCFQAKGVLVTFFNFPQIIKILTV